LGDGQPATEIARRITNDRLYAAVEEGRLFSSIKKSIELNATISAPLLAAGLLQTALIGIERAEADRAKLWSWAVEHLNAATSTNGKPLKYVGDLPTSAWLIGELVDNPPMTLMFYQLASALEHNSWHGIKRVLTERTNNQGQTVYGMRLMTADDLAGSTWIGVLAMAKAARALFRVCGWHTDKLEGAIQRLDGAWNRIDDEKVITQMRAIIAAAVG
jgi:hypothetical protein